VLLALGLYMALLLRLVQNAQRAKDRAGMFLVMGVAAALGFHVLVNVATWRNPRLSRQRDAVTVI